MEKINESRKKRKAKAKEKRQNSGIDLKWKWKWVKRREGRREGKLLNKNEYESEWE